MTANQDLQRRLANHYAGEPPLRAPDWVLQAALTAIDRTPQRRGLNALRRYFDMPLFKLAAAAALVLAIGGFALWQLAPLGPGGPGPTPSPSPTAVPSPTSAAYVPPALTETFTSDVHGLTLTYPTGWTAQAATKPWTNSLPPNFDDPSGDLFFDPGRDTGHLFIAVASQRLGGMAFDDWLSGFLAEQGCTRAGAIEIGGADEAVDTSCDLALASSGGRGYVFMLYRSSDDFDLQSFDWAAWFDEFLATVQLHPEDAVGEVPTESP